MMAEDQERFGHPALDRPDPVLERTGYEVAVGGEGQGQEIRLGRGSTGHFRVHSLPGVEVWSGLADKPRRRRATFPAPGVLCLMIDVLYAVSCPRGMWTVPPLCLELASTVAVGTAASRRRFRIKGVAAHE